MATMTEIAVARFACTTCFAQVGESCMAGTSHNVTKVPPHARRLGRAEGWSLRQGEVVTLTAELNSARADLAVANQRATALRLEVLALQLELQTHTDESDIGDDTESDSKSIA